MALMYINLFNTLLFAVIGIVISSLFTLTGIIILIVGIVKKRKFKETVRLKKKKYPTILIALGSVFICIPLITIGTIITNSAVNRITYERSITREKKLTPEEQCEIIMEAVQNKEKEPIKKLFCENAKNAPYLDIDTKLNIFLNFMNGNIVSYDKPYKKREGLSTNGGGVDENDAYIYIYNILTDTGNTYTISIHFFQVYKKYPDFVGIVSLHIMDANKYNEENNYPRDSLYRIDVDYPR